MLNNLIGIPSNEEEVLNEILKKSTDEKSEDIAYSLSDLATMYVRGLKKKPSDKLSLKIKENNIDVSVELLKAYVSELEFALNVIKENNYNLEEKLDSECSNIQEFFEKNSQSKVVSNFAKNSDCQQLLNEYKKFYKYFYVMSLKEDSKDCKKNLQMHWKLGRLFDAFTSWIKVEIYNIRYEWKSLFVESPLDVSMFERDR